MVTEKTEIVLGTRNHGKIAEFRSLLRGVPVKVLSFKDFEDIPDVEEDGTTFRENAAKKARAISRATGRVAVSDDSGLVIDYLDGQPGVYSARFAGEKATGRENSRKVLRLLDCVPWEERNARFVCVMCASNANGKMIYAEGVCHGKICFEMKGSHGFGYDPIFVPDGHRVTMAEMSFDQKNRISHRAEATDRFRSIFREFLDSLG